MRTAQYVGCQSPHRFAQGSRPIFTALVNFCWSLFKWCLLLAIMGAVAVGGYLYFRLDDEIRRQVEDGSPRTITNFDVRVGRRGSIPIAASRSTISA